MVAAAVGVGTAVAGVAGSAMASDAAGSAADSQAQSAADANALQREIYDRNTENFQPYLNAGNAGLNELMLRMGLGSGGQTKTEAQLREELSPKFTTQSGAANPPSLRELGWRNSYNDATWNYDPNKQKWGYQVKYSTGGDADESRTDWVYANDWQPGGGSTLDENALNAEIQKQLAEQSTQQQANKDDPNYGWLLERFGKDDFEADPGYQFRLDQGQQALDRMQAARGGLLSGRAMKDASEYNSGMSSQEYQNSYNRYNNDQTNQFNRLASIAGIGQSSASALAGVGSNYANQVGNNLIGAGNAAAAGTVGSANAWNQGLGTMSNSLANIALNRQSGYAPAGNAVNNVNGMSGNWGAVR